MSLVYEINKKWSSWLLVFKRNLQYNWLSIVQRMYETVRSTFVLTRPRNVNDYGKKYLKKKKNKLPILIGFYRLVLWIYIYFFLQFRKYQVAGDCINFVSRIKNFFFFISNIRTVVFTLLWHHLPTIIYEKLNFLFKW